MKRLAFSLSLISILLLGISPTQALDSPPLSKSISSGVSPCGSPSPLELPLITWGGDIATIHANGDQRTTASDSILGKLGLKLKLVREDVFSNQVKALLSCKSPFLRGTMGMINMASEVTDRDPRTKLKVIYQMTWSAGGDALVVKGEIKKPKDLRGKTIAVQAYGPHVDYLSKILSDAGLSVKDVKIKWTKDLTGTDNTPMAAFYKSDVQAAMVIIPDALALTSSGTVGTGAEDSVKGARILLSTKSANRIIADVYAVRSDFLESNRETVTKLVHGLMIAEESLKKLVKEKKSRQGEFKKMITASAEILLDSPHATEDTEAMYSDAQFVGWKGNVKFFGDQNYPRNLPRLTNEIQTAFLSLGLLSKKVSLGHAAWDYNKFKAQLADTSGVEAPRFDTTQVARVVSRKQQQGTLSKEGLFSFEVYFKPNQNSFSPDHYQKDFNRVIDLASTYGGAVITVEGHSDPLGYLKKKKKGEAEIVLKRIKQAAKNLSLARANAVRDSIIGYASGKGIRLDPSQFAVVGYGIMKPKSGMCGAIPCAPKTEQEWLNNMRVEFRMIQVEAEESVFKPL